MLVNQSVTKDLTTILQNSLVNWKMSDNLTLFHTMSHILKMTMSKIGWESDKQKMFIND